MGTLIYEEVNSNEGGKIPLNQPLIYIYIYIYTALSPLPTVNPNFLFAPNKISSRNKLFLGIKNIGGAFAPPPPIDAQGWCISDRRR